MGKKVSGLVVRSNTVLVSVITADTASTANYGIWRSTNGDFNAVDYSSNLWWGDTGLARDGLSPSSQWKHLTHSNAVAGIPGGGTSNNSSPHADSWDMAIDAASNLIGGDDGEIFPPHQSPEQRVGRRPCRGSSPRPWW